MHEFIVYGPAATKGSTRSFVSRRTGRIVTLADAKRLPAWTQAVAWAARESKVPFTARPHPVVVEAVWTFLPPQSRKKAEIHAVKPDVDKLARALLDALTGVLYEDDAQVHELRVRKQYGTEMKCVVRIESGGV